MLSLRSDALRWFLVLPFAVAATVVAQLLATSIAHPALLAAVGAESGSAWWTAKAVASPVMGAVFVSAAWFVAPSSKRPAALLALGAVAVWAGVLVYSTVGGGGVVWPAVLGTLGFAGGFGALVVLRRRS